MNRVLFLFILFSTQLGWTQESETIFQLLGCDKPVLVHKSFSAYQYAPTIMRDGNVLKMWWCCENSGDAICFSKKNAGQKWTNPVRVFGSTKRTSKSHFDGMHTCDPSVIATSKTGYIMAYGGYNFGPGTKIGIARRTNSLHFKRVLNRGHQPTIEGHGGWTSWHAGLGGTHHAPLVATLMKHYNPQRDRVWQDVAVFSLSADSRLHYFQRDESGKWERRPHYVGDIRKNFFASDFALATWQDKQHSHGRIQAYAVKKGTNTLYTNWQNPYSPGHARKLQFKDAWNVVGSPIHDVVAHSDAHGKVYVFGTWSGQIFGREESMLRQGLLPVPKQKALFFHSPRVCSGIVPDAPGNSNSIVLFGLTGTNGHIYYKVRNRPAGSRWARQWSRPWQRIKVPNKPTDVQAIQGKKGYAHLFALTRTGTIWTVRQSKNQRFENKHWSKIVDTSVANHPGSVRSFHPPLALAKGGEGRIELFVRATFQGYGVHLFNTYQFPRGCNKHWSDCAVKAIEQNLWRGGKWEELAGRHPHGFGVVKNKSNVLEVFSVDDTPKRGLQHAWQKRQQGNTLVHPYGAGQPSLVHIGRWYYMFFTDTTGPASSRSTGSGYYVVRSKDWGFRVGAQEYQNGRFVPLRKSLGFPYMLSKDARSIAELANVDIAYIPDRRLIVELLAGSLRFYRFRPGKKIRIVDHVRLPQADWIEGLGIVRSPRGHVKLQGNILNLHIVGARKKPSIRDRSVFGAEIWSMRCRVRLSAK